MAMFIYLLAVAVDTAPAPPATDAATPPHVYLHPSSYGCDGRAPSDDRASSDEVVVCGSRDADARYRLHPSDDHEFDDKPIRAETNLFGDSTLGAHVDHVKVGGFVSRRAMVTFTLPF